MRLTALWETFDAGEAERNVIRLHDKIIDFETSMGPRRDRPVPVSRKPRLAEENRDGRLTPRSVALTPRPPLPILEKGSQNLG